jgi:DNA-binding PadR family transcriptional regulator
MSRYENALYTIVKGLLPYIILAIVEREGEVSVYDALNRIHIEFNVPMSAATIYSTIYRLERQGCVERVEGKPKYRVTDAGLVLLENAEKTMRELFPKIEAFLEGQLPTHK